MPSLRPSVFLPSRLPSYGCRKRGTRDQEKKKEQREESETSAAAAAFADRAGTSVADPPPFRGYTHKQTSKAEPPTASGTSTKGTRAHTPTRTRPTCPYTACGPLLGRLCIRRLSSYSPFSVLNFCAVKDAWFWAHIVAAAEECAYRCFFFFLLAVRIAGHVFSLSLCRLLFVASERRRPTLPGLDVKIRRRGDLRCRRSCSLNERTPRHVAQEREKVKHVLVIILFPFLPSCTSLSLSLSLSWSPWPISSLCVVSRFRSGCRVNSREDSQALFDG